MAADSTKKTLAGKTTFATPVRVLSEKEDAVAAKGICPYCDKVLVKVVEVDIPMQLCTVCLFLFWIGEIKDG